MIWTPSMAGMRLGVILLRQASDTRDVTVRHIGGGTGNIRLNTSANKALLKPQWRSSPVSWGDR